MDSVQADLPAGLYGMEKKKVLPTPSTDSTHTFPFSAST
jgi:hypothetical protein